MDPLADSERTVGVATKRGMALKLRSGSWEEQEIFYILYSVQAGSEVHTFPYKVIQGVKLPGRESQHSSSCSTEVKNM